MPVEGEGPGQAQGGVGQTLPARPVEGRPQVLDLAVEALEPLLLVGTAQLRLGPGHQRQAPGQVGVAGGHVLARLQQPVASEVADRLQQAEPGLPAGGLAGDQRAVDQPDEQVEDVAGMDIAAVDLAERPADLLRRLQGEAAGEHRQPAQEDLVAGGEQVVAPRHRPLEALVADVAGAGTEGEQSEAVVETGRDPAPRRGR